MAKTYTAKSEIQYGDDWFSITGTQLLSSERVRMTCRFRHDNKPARFKFRGHTIPATVENLASKDARGLTTIENEAVSISQIEHVLSALVGMNALDSELELAYLDGGDDREISPPVCNLDARDFALAILSCFKARDISRAPQAIQLDHVYCIKEEGPDVEDDPAIAIFAPLPYYRIAAQVNFPYFWGKQTYATDVEPLSYLRSICWARSFFGTPHPHKAEWETLRERYPGLIRERTNHYRSMMLDYDEQRWITPLVTKDEPVRHKILDVLGDLALLGRPLNAGVFIYKPHHQFNRHCARQLAESLGL